MTDTANNMAHAQPETAEAQHAQTIGTLTEKWGWEALSTGFTAIPNALFYYLKRRRATPMERLVLLHLLRYWWRPGEWPYPSKRALAEEIGCGEKTVRRALAGLEKHGLIEIIERRREYDRNETNLYSLAPLVANLGHLAVAQMVEQNPERALILFPENLIVQGYQDKLRRQQFPEEWQREWDASWDRAIEMYGLP